MRIALLVILVCLSITGVTTEQFRGATGDATKQGLSQNENQHSLLRHVKDPEEEMETKKLGGVIISRALGRRVDRGKSSRSLLQSVWDRWQRAGSRGSSDGRSRSSSTNKVKAKAEKKGSQEVESYDSWILRYRAWTMKWRKKQRKKTGKAETQYYESNWGIFKIRIPLFSSKMTSGYNKNERMLQRDLTRAAQFKVKLFVEQRRTVDYRDVVLGFQPAKPAFSPEATDNSPSAGEVDDFETNTVEESVDEGDLLKVRKDGKYAFTAFGGNLIVWDVAKNNSTVTTMALPPIESKYDGLPPWLLYDEATETEQVSKPEDEETNGGDRDLQLIASPSFYCWGPISPTIHSLLTYEDRLVVVASGYGPSIRDKLNYTPSFYDAFETKMLMYDTSSLDTEGKLTFLKSVDVHGSFESLRAVENKAHLVTFSNLDLYTHIERPLSHEQPEFRDLEDEEYYRAAQRLAKQYVIPNFVDRLMTDLSARGELPDLARVGMWEEEASTDPKTEEALFDQGIMTYYAQVTSFDMLDKDLNVKEAGCFMPTGWGHTYANENMLIIAGEGWNSIARLGGSIPTTYFLGFALLPSGEAVPATVGKVEGTLLNEYAVDIVDGYMRVAVTIQNNRWWFWGTREETSAPPTENYVKVFKIPDLTGTVLSSDSGPKLEEVGSTKSLGEENEVFTGVRFSDKYAYVVTFFQTDPLYVISFENATSPEVLGELKITGFSSYLHFINDEETLLLGVGQEADTEGQRLGLQVALYDVSDPTDPRVIKKFPFELDKDVYSSSTAEFDFKSFRYVKLGDDFGILIIPLRVDAYNIGVLDEGEEEKEDPNFNGFVLLDVNRTSISERFRIPHEHPVYYHIGCYQYVQLADRSFVVGGDVTTTKGQSIQKYDLDTEKLLSYNNLGANAKE